MPEWTVPAAGQEPAWVTPGRRVISTGAGLRRHRTPTTSISRVSTDAPATYVDAIVGDRTRALTVVGMPPLRAVVPAVLLDTLTPARSRFRTQPHLVRTWRKRVPLVAADGRGGRPPILRWPSDRSWVVAGATFDQPSRSAPRGMVETATAGSEGDMIDEQERAAQLIAAEERAEQLFGEVERRGLIAAGERETVVSNRVRDLGAEMFGTSRHWHKRIVRAGPNTLEPYRENPPDRVICDDDIVFLDLGPIFAGWEADFGRTFVLGDDPVKLALQADLPRLWAAGRACFEAHADITGAELYAHVAELAAGAGWDFGNVHAGHLVGEFPHETIDGDRIESYIAPGNANPMRRTDRQGRRCHWILELHLVDRAREIGGFHEQLLTLR